MKRSKRLKLKICLLGDPAVGKTSLIQKYIYNFFGDTYMRTLGTKVSRKVVHFVEQKTNIDYEITMIIWDIMGQKFSSMPLDKYLKLTQGALVVCDATRHETYQSLIEWKKTLYKENGEVPIIYLANKIDLENEIVVTTNVFKKFAKKEKVDYFFTSAKTGENVNNAFLKLGELIVAQNFKVESKINLVSSSPSTQVAATPTMDQTGLYNRDGTEPVPITEPMVADSTINNTDHANSVRMAGTTPTNKQHAKSYIKNNQKSKPENIEIKPGLGYIIQEEKPERCLKIFKQLLKQKIHGLCITRTHPQRIRDEYQLQKVPIYWLSADSPAKENILVPTFLPQLNTIIIDFIQKYDDVVILLEGIEYLIDQNDFKAVLSLIHSLNDNIMGSKARLLLPIDPLILDKRELHMLSRDFKIL